ncbi:hypothetical protein PWT90_09538 [Aphanocladium album]|nr:hypothetical protein PWT90_09538 [Aphanocladium album]
MQETDIQQTVYIPGKEPANAAAMGPRIRTNGISYHQHSNSTPPPNIHNRNHYAAVGSHNLITPPAVPRPRSQSTSAMGEMTTVLVGRKRQAFVVNRRLLCAASPFFRDQLQQKMHSSPSPPSPCPSSSSSSSSSCSPSSAYSPSSSRSPASLSSLSSRSQQQSFYTYKPVTLWLPGESTTMFALFVEWLHAPASFRSYLDETVAMAHGTSDEATQLLHWALIRLHLFASHLGLLALQDLAMDAVQDLYLRCDWDIAPSVIAYLYTRCDALHSVRLRRWAVAMVAFSLTVAWHLHHDLPTAAAAASASAVAVEKRLPGCHQRTASSSSSSASAVCDPARLHSMLDALPEFAADYTTHVRSMRDAGLDMRFKNPQLRIPANTLRNDKRLFGFRECSFHSHRAAVGQGPCPHAAFGIKAADTGSMLDLAAPPEEAVEDEEEDDDGVVAEDDDIKQWEKEWADELDEEPVDYNYVPTTSLRPPPPPPPPLPPKTLPHTTLPKVATGRISTRPLMSKFGNYLPRFPSRNSDLLPTPV